MRLVWTIIFLVTIFKQTVFGCAASPIFDCGDYRPRRTHVFSTGVYMSLVVRCSLHDQATSLWYGCHAVDWASSGILTIQLQQQQSIEHPLQMLALRISACPSLCMSPCVCLSVCRLSRPPATRSGLALTFWEADVDESLNCRTGLCGI